MDRSPDKREVPMFEVPSHREALKVKLDELQREPALCAKRRWSVGHRLALATALCLILVAAITLTALWLPSPGRNGNTGSQSDNSIRGITAPLPSSMTGEKPASSLDEAMRTTGMSVRVPKDTLGATITAINTVLATATDKNMGGGSYIYWTYSNGMLVSAESPTQMDYAAQIANMQHLNSITSVHPSALPSLVTVQGHQGMLWPSHTNVGDTAPGAAVLYWSDSGVAYTLYPPGFASSTSAFKATVSGKTGSTVVDDLLKVANSMYR